MKTNYILAFAAVLILTAGCQTRERVVKQSKVTASHFRDSLVKVNPQIDKTLGSLSKLAWTDQPTPGAQFRQYQNDLEQLQELIYPLRYQVDRLRREGAAYFNAWSEELILAHSSAERQELEAARARARNRYTTFMGYLESAATDFRAVYNEMKDIEEYIAADISKANAHAQQPLVNEVADKAARLKGRIDTLVSEIDSWVGK